MAIEWYAALAAGVLVGLSIGSYIGTSMGSSAHRVSFIQCLDCKRKVKRLSDSEAIPGGDQVWLSDLVRLMWPEIDVMASGMIRNTVEEAIKTNLPFPFKGLHFTKTSFGTKPLKFYDISVSESPYGDGIKMECDVWYEGDADMQLKSKLGTFGVKDIRLTGRLSILLRPIIGTVPLIGAYQFAFINPPDIDMDFYGWLNIADGPKLQKIFRGAISDVIKSMMVAPQFMLVKLGTDISFYNAYEPPKGILRVEVEAARNLRHAPIGLERHPDTFVILKLGAEKVRTDTVKDSYDPEFINGSQDLLITDMMQKLTVDLYDEDKLDADDLMATIDVTAKDLTERAPEAAWWDLPGIKGGAQVKLGARFLSLSKNKEQIKAIREAGSSTDHCVAVVAVLISKATGLKCGKTVYVKVSSSEFEAQTFIASESQTTAREWLWDTSIPAKLRTLSQTLTISLVDSDDDKVLGTTELTPQTLVDDHSEDRRNGITVQLRGGEVTLHYCALLYAVV